MSMHCPLCNGKTNTVDTRLHENNIVRRRRACTECPNRFTTYEKVVIDDIEFHRTTQLFMEELIMDSEDLVCKLRNLRLKLKRKTES